MFTCLLFIALNWYRVCAEDLDDASWPPINPSKCTQNTKQKAMYGRMTYDPPINKKNPIQEMSVNVNIDDLKFSPYNVRKAGGFYVSYTTGIYQGPGGYFGVQMTARGGSFLFSIWDADRWIGKGADKKPKASDKLTWPLNRVRCKRNCQDCGIPDLRQWKKEGLTTGTQCGFKYPLMKIGDEYKVMLKRKVKQMTINTKDYDGMPKAHVKFGEVDRDITGAVWVVSVTDIRRNKIMEIGEIMFEGDGRGMNRLGTFDEMLGCNKCNAIYHKDTRYGPTVVYEDGTIRLPKKMEGITRASVSTCQQYMISGSKNDDDISFESGPLTKGTFPKDGKYHTIWEK